MHAIPLLSSHHVEVGDRILIHRTKGNMAGLYCDSHGGSKTFYRLLIGQTKASVTSEVMIHESMAHGHMSLAHVPAVFLCNPF